MFDSISLCNDSLDSFSDGGYSPDADFLVKAAIDIAALAVKEGPVSLCCCFYHLITENKRLGRIIFNSLLYCSFWHTLVTSLLYILYSLSIYIIH